MENQVLRHEIKYYISRPGAAIIKSRLKHLMRPDSHADGFEPYFIRSLYFDDLHYSAYRDKLAGVSERNKYRIRFYNRDPAFTVFEKKQKIGDRIRKTSARLTSEQIPLMTEGRILDFGGEGLLREYDILTRSANLRPVVLVDYDRTVFSYPVGNVRITLDENITSRLFTGDLYDYSAAFPVIGAHEVVLEVKFDSLLPPQISCLLRDVPKAHSAVSKYCLCCSVL